MAYVTTHDETTDKCIVCNAPTQYKRSDHVDYRLNYIEGAGQLCPDCFKTEEKIFHSAEGLDKFPQKSQVLSSFWDVLGNLFFHPEHLYFLKTFWIFCFFNQTSPGSKSQFQKL